MVKKGLFNYLVWGKHPHGLSLNEYPIPISIEDPIVFPKPNLANAFNFSFDIPITGLKTYLFEFLKFSNPKPIPKNGENVSSKK